VRAVRRARRASAAATGAGAPLELPLRWAGALPARAKCDPALDSLYDACLAAPSAASTSDASTTRPLALDLILALSGGEKTLEAFLAGRGGRVIRRTQWPESAQARWVIEAPAAAVRKSPLSIAFCGSPRGARPRAAASATP
jgi:hypothetical protein